MKNIRGSIIGKWNKNKYRVLQKIGQGGIGTVYKVADTGGRRWALKISENANSIIREYNIMRELKELDGIPHVYEIDDYETGKEILYFFVMEFIEGKNLKEYLKDNTIYSREGVGISLIILKNLKELIARGYAYTDIKLENILLDSKSNRIVFIDFGGVTNKDWGIKEYTPAYNMISWGIDEEYNHQEGTIFSVTMVLITMICKKEFSPINNKITEVKKIIKKTNINALLKKTLLKALCLGYKDIDSYEKDLKQIAVNYQQGHFRTQKWSMDIVNLIFITSISIFLIVIFLGMH